MTAQPDLLAPIEAPAADGGPVPGTFDGPEGWRDAIDAIMARVRVWCGPLHGWRDVGEMRGGLHQSGGLLWHQGRLSVGLSFDLGPAVLSRREVKGLDAIETLASSQTPSAESQS